MLSVQIREAHEKRAKLVNQAKDILERAEKEKRDLTAEEDTQFADLHRQGDALKAEAEALQKREEQAQARATRQEGAERELHALRQHGIDRNLFPASAAGEDPTSPAGRQIARSVFLQQEALNLAIGGWCRQQNGIPVSDREQQAAKACGIKLEGNGIDIALPRNYSQVRREVRNALSTTTGATGGFATIPEGFVPALEMAMLLYGPMLETSEIIRTEHGEPMGWPTANDTGNKGRQIGEAAAVAATPDPAFGKVRWNAYKYTSDELLVPYELLEDGAFDLAPKLGDMCGERLGRILNEKATIGTGAATMKGIVPASTQGKETASASAITADEILDLIHSVGRAYRVGAGFMFNDATCLVLRKLKDGEGRYLWQQGLSGGAPDTLATYPVHINDDMASIAATAKVMLFGLLSKYKIRQVGSMRLYRLVERHRENDEDAFLSFIRADGNLLDAGVAPVKHLVMHA